MSEERINEERINDELDNLTDEDFEAIGRIMEGGISRVHGEGLLSMMEGAEERHEDQARALLDAITRAQLDQEDEKE